MNSRQRSQLIGLAMTTDSIFNVGKDGLSPEFTQAVREALEKRELVKIGVLKNCDADKRELAQTLAERTGSEVVQIIGSKLVLFKYQKDSRKRKIELVK